MKFTKSFALAATTAFLLCCLLTVTAFGQQSGVLWYNSTTGQVQTWLQDSNGTYLGSQYVVPNVCGGPCTNWEIVGTGDFNNDGYQDILWYNTSNGQLESWLLDGEGNYLGVQPVDLPCDTASGCAPAWQIVGTGDFNEDGNQDIVLYNSTSGYVAVWMLNGHGHVLGSGGPFFIPFVLDHTCPGPCQYGRIVGTGDFNNDGHEDVLWFDGTKFDVWLLDGQGHVIGHQTPDPICDSASGCANSWIIQGNGDVNNDGFPDISFYDPVHGTVNSWLLDPMGHQKGVLQTVMGINYVFDLFGPHWFPSAMIKFGPALFHENWQPGGLGNVPGTITLNGAGFTNSGTASITYEIGINTTTPDQVPVSSTGTFTTQHAGIPCDLPGMIAYGVTVTAYDKGSGRSAVAKYNTPCQVK